MRSHPLDDVLGVIHFFIAKPKHMKAAHSRGFCLDPIPFLDVGIVVNNAVEFDQEAMRERREVIHKISDLALLAEVRAFMLQLSQNLPELFFRWR